MRSPYSASSLRPARRATAARLATVATTMTTAAIGREPGDDADLHLVVDVALVDRLLDEDRHDDPPAAPTNASSTVTPAP